MKYPKNPKLRDRAQKLRKEMTREERHLWYDFLKLLPVNIHRQQVIGNYIVDFYCASAKLIIELDGSQHYDPAGQAADSMRDQWLRAQGFTVLRYSNLDVSCNFPGVCDDILLHIQALTRPSS